MGVAQRILGEGEPDFHRIALTPCCSIVVTMIGELSLDGILRRWVTKKRLELRWSSSTSFKNGRLG